MRVLHAVERQHERLLRARKRAQEIILAPGRQGGNLGGDTLMHRLAQELLQVARVRAFNGQAVARGKVDNLAHPCIVASDGEREAHHPLRPSQQQRAHGVQTKDGLDASSHSSTSSRSIRPSMGLTAVTTIFTCAPARSRRPWRRPTQP